MHKHPNFWAWVLLFVSFVWGIEFALVHTALDSLGPNTFNAIRFLVAAITLSIVLPFTTKAAPGAWKQSSIWRHGFVLGTLLMVGFSSQSIGLQYTTASNAGFITGLNTVLVPITVWVWLREKQPWVVWPGVGLAIVGTLLLTGGLSGFGVGESWVLVCAFAFAIHIVYTGKNVNNTDALRMTQIQLISVSTLSFVLAGLFEQDSLKALPELLFTSHNASYDIWLAILVGGTLGTTLAFVAQSMGQKTIPAWRVGLIFATEPMFAALGGYWLLDETLTMMGMLGGAMIIVGIVIAELSEDRKDGAPIHLD